MIIYIQYEFYQIFQSVIFDNYELLKVFAYQLEQNSQYDLVLFVFKKILDLRPEDAQSYRYLAQANQ